MDESGNFNTDELLIQLGGCGRFQVILAALVALSQTPRVLSALLMSFGNYNPGWRCNDNLNMTLMDWSNDTHPNGSFFNESIYDGHSNTSLGYQTDSCIGFQSCQNIEFQHQASTIVSQFNLVCDKDWVPATMIALQNAGNTFGALVTGYIGDRYGRKWANIGSRVASIFFNLLALFSVSWPMFATALFFIGVTDTFAALGDVLRNEYVAPDWRVKANSIPTFSVLTLVFVLIAMLTKDWKKITTVSIVTGVVLVIPLFWIPESMRWLSVRGKKKRLMRAVTKIATVNKVDLPDKDKIISLVKINKGEDKKQGRQSTYLDLLRKGYRLGTFTVGFLFLTLSFVWIVLSFGVSKFPGNLYMNMMLITIPDIPSNIVSFTVANRTGRKPSLFAIYLIGALGMFGLVAMDRFSSGQIRVVGIISFVMLTKLVTNVGWVLLTTCVLEMYPTVVRSTANSYTILLSGLSGIFAPYLIPTNDDTFYISYLVLALMLLVSGGLVLLLRETKGIDLLDTWEMKNKKTNENKDDDNKVITRL